MASELHTLIEEELKNKNYKSSGNDEEKALMGALRVEVHSRLPACWCNDCVFIVQVIHDRTPLQARVKEHQHQKKILTVKRSICVGGGLLVVIVLWAVLALKSKSATKSDTGKRTYASCHAKVY